jgi:hypothetical protein
LHKVKAHDGNNFNDIANSLAKNGRSLLPITPVLTGLGSRNLAMSFRDITIESSIRKFIKNLFDARQFGDFLSLHRNRDLRLLTDSKDINWIAIWNILTLDSSLMITSFADAHLKTFMIKNFVDELPVLSRMEKLRPDLYKNWKCVGCNLITETSVHLWSCPAYSHTMEMILSLTKNHLVSLFKDYPKFYESSLLPELLDLFDRIFVLPLSRNDGYINIIRLRIPSSLFDQIHLITRKKSKCFSIITQLTTFFLKELLEKIWKPRCQLMIDKEKSLGITKKVKLTKGAVSTLVHSTDEHVPSA